LLSIQKRRKIPIHCAQNSIAARNESDPPITRRWETIFIDPQFCGGPSTGKNWASENVRIARAHAWLAGIRGEEIFSNGKDCAQFRGLTDQEKSSAAAPRGGSLRR
jgi:hypothetical protein